MMKTAHQQVLLLSSAQACFQIATVVVMTVGGLAGGQAASDPALATLPIAFLFLGTVVASFPASIWMVRVGRRIGFIGGALLGVMGGLVVSLGIWENSLALMCAGTFLIGNYQAFAQFYRFAAAEVAEESFRPRAISLVLAGGVVAAVIGPILARIGGSVVQPEYVGSFLIVALVSLIAVAALSLLREAPPQPADSHGHAARQWRVIVVQPAYMVALFATATGSGIMILGMTAAPIAMAQHHHGLGTIAGVIQLHVLGMFFPSFFTGALIARFGVLLIMFCGLLLFVAHISMSLAGTEFTSFASALTLLGVGWNFLYVGGTTLLTTTYSEAERGRAQAINDTTVFVVAFACSFGAAALLHAVGWRMLNLLLLPWIGCAMLALAWLGLKLSNSQNDNAIN